MPAIELPDPPPTDGMVVLRGFESAAVPALVAACQDPGQRPDVYFAPLR